MCGECLTSRALQSHPLLSWSISASEFNATLKYPAMEEIVSRDEELLSRITVCADVFGGKPIIRDMRVAVEHILGMLASGESAETILREYALLEAEDIQACLLFAHRSMSGAKLGSST